jgi:sorbose reductase
MTAQTNGHSNKTSIRWPNPTLPDSVFKMFDMHGKVAIITGGTGGIGYEVARGLAEAGCDIALWYHKSSDSSKVAATIERDFGVKCKSYQCDVSSFEQVSEYISTDIQNVLTHMPTRCKQASMPSSKTSDISML